MTLFHAAAQVDVHQPTLPRPVRIAAPSLGLTALDPPTSSQLNVFDPTVTAPVADRRMEEGTADV